MDESSCCIKGIDKKQKCLDSNQLDSQPGSNKKTDGNFIPLYIEQNHWITISNIHATDPDTVIYSSLQGKISTEVQHQMEKIREGRTEKS